MKIILGPPGTGKTTHLLGCVSDALKGEISPERIGYLAFTKKAATEAITRACERFNRSPRDFTYFRTIHSLAFFGLSMKKTRMMGKERYDEFSKIMGIEISGRWGGDDLTTATQKKGDRLLFLDNLSRSRKEYLKDTWANDNMDLHWEEVDWFNRGLQTYKESRNLLDFTDLLEQFCKIGFVPELDLLVVDEAQDLSALQWDVVEKLKSKAKEILVAGDDDQAIFRWAGADIDHFQNLEGEKHILGKSYRVPKSVQKSADKILSHVSKRYEKVWEPRDIEGRVEHVVNFESLDLTKGDWLILARNISVLERAEEVCKTHGYFFSKNGRNSVSKKLVRTVQVWEALRKGKSVSYEDALSVMRKTSKKGSFSRANKDRFYTMDILEKEYGLRTREIWHQALDYIPVRERIYLIALLRRGEKITKEPRIILSTIHGAKGGEADNVVVFLDMAPRTFKGMEKDPDDELRVFYVAFTRARENLFLVQPETPFSFALV